MPKSILARPRAARKPAEPASIDSVLAPLASNVAPTVIPVSATDTAAPVAPDTFAGILAANGIPYVIGDNAAHGIMLAAIAYLANGAAIGDNPGAHPATKARRAMLSETLNPVQKHGISPRNVRLVAAFAAASGTVQPGARFARLVGASESVACIAETGGLRNAVRGNVILPDNDSNGHAVILAPRATFESICGATRLANLESAFTELRNAGFKPLI